MAHAHVSKKNDEKKYLSGACDVLNVVTVVMNVKIIFVYYMCKGKIPFC